MWWVTADRNVRSAAAAPERHEGQDGHSQATIILMYGPGAGGPDFPKYWATKLGFTGNEPEETEPGQRRGTRRRYDDNENICYEYATSASSNG